jgi:hypothetical protein
VSVQSVMGGAGSFAKYLTSQIKAAGPSLTDIVGSGGGHRAGSVEDGPNLTASPHIQPRFTVKPAPKFEPRLRHDPTPIIEPRHRLQSDRVEISSMMPASGAPSAVDRPLLHHNVPWNPQPGENTYAPSRETDVVIKRAHSPSAGTLLDVFI